MFSTNLTIAVLASEYDENLGKEFADPPPEKKIAVPLFLIRFS